MKTIAALIAIAGIASVSAVANAQTYAFTGTPLAVPDSPAGPVTLDSPVIAGAGNLLSVSAGLTFNPNHTFIGDLVITLTYTPPGDSPVSIDIVNRVGRTGGAGFGSGVNFGGPYVFSDSATQSIWTAALAAATLVPAGTYQPSGLENAASTFAPFVGLPAGGTFQLSFQDFAGGDTGTVTAATVTVIAGAASIPPSGNAATATVTRNPVLPGPFSTVFAVSTTGGFNPVSTVTGVRANFTSVLGAGHTNDQLFDDGTNGDAVAGDGIYSLSITPLPALADGPYSVPFTITDNRVPPRTGTGTGTVTLRTILGPAGATDLGTLVNDTEATGSADAIDGEAAWFKFTSAFDAATPDTFVDVYGLSSSGYGDTYMAIYDSTGTFLASNDDSGFGALSQLSFGRTGPSRFYNGGDPARGVNGPLAGGLYYIAIVKYAFPNTFSSPFGFAAGTPTTATTATIGVTASNTPVPPPTPPTATDLGTLAFTGTPAVRNGSFEIAGREVNWLKFTLDAAVDIGGSRFVDIDTNGSTMDTHIGLFDSAGNIIDTDDDSGAGVNSAFTFGSIDPTGRDTNPLGFPNDGFNGGLAAGTYYMALNFFIANYDFGFVATTTSAGSGGTYVYNIYSGDQNGSTGPICIADVNGDQIVDGADFILFINSFGVGDVSQDAIADVAGGIPSGGDGIVDGTDFIAFINAFGAGC